MLSAFRELENYNGPALCSFRRIHGELKWDLRRTLVNVPCEIWEGTWMVKKMVHISIVRKNIRKEVKEKGERGL